MLIAFSSLAEERTVDLSVITATLPGRSGADLQRAYHSLCQQQGDYFWEWLIQIDGEMPDQLPHFLQSDRRVRIMANGKHLGVAATRNMALERSLGGAVCYLDDDDELCPEAFQSFLRPLEKDPDLLWAGGQMLYAYPDKPLHQFQSLLLSGKVEAGELFDAWHGPNLRFPHPPSTIAGRTDVIRALGGWPALPQGDDLGLFAALSEEGPGFLGDEGVYIYNQHDANTVSLTGFEELESLSRNIIWNRIALQRKHQAK